MSETKMNKINETNHYEYIVAMGISTGGPKLLSQIVRELDESLLATYVIVQHMPVGFTKTLAQRLNELTSLEVKEAVHGELLKKGTIYIAPGGKHLRFSTDQGIRISLSDEALYKGHKPSVNVMFKALAELKVAAKKYIAVIMTGMGTDGLEGVQHLRKQHPCKVIAQDEHSSVVYGMPKAIINENLADYIVPGCEIPKIIKKIVGDTNGS